MKKFFIKTLYLGIILCIAGLAGCMNPLNPPKEAPLSADTGRVTVVIGPGESAKTLAPASEDFTKYTVTFSGPAAHDPVDITGAGAQVELQAGSWTISATGYTGDDPDYVAVAEGSVTVAVTKNGTTQANILLKPKTGSALEKGTFSYSLEIPYGTDSAELIISPAAEGEAQTITLSYNYQGINGSEELDPGEYLVRIRLQANSLYAGLTEALHIYAGLTSTLPLKEFTAEDFKAAVSEGFDLTSLVTAPALWADPVTAFAGGDQYTGAVAWKEADGETAVTGVFAAGTVYKAVVTLQAKTGYTFTGVAADSFTHSGASAAANPEDSGVVTITFPATAAGTVTDVTVTGGDTSLAQGGDKTFTATVSGDPAPPQTVSWTVTGNNDTGTTIGAASGKLNIALNESAESLTVTAASAADNTVSGSVTVTVTPAAVRDIGSATDLAKIGGEEGYPLGGKYKLTAGLTLSDWTPIGTPEAPFAGVIDGNSQTITLQSFAGASIDGAYIGVFGYVKGASATSKAGIKDLTITSSVNASADPAGRQAVGTLAGYAENTEIESITLSGALTFSSSKTLYLGGIAGYIQAGTVIEDSAVSAALTITSGNGPSPTNITGTPAQAYSFIGGAAGIFAGGGEILDTHNTGNIQAFSEVSGSQVFAGGIAGGSYYGFVTAYQGKIEDCSYTGDLHAKAKGSWTFAGGIAGTIVGGTVDDIESTTRIARSFATGTISVAGTGSGWPYIGGIVGYNYYGALVSQSYFTGTVIADKSNDYTGGIAGYNSQTAAPNNSRIEDCWTSGTVKGYNNAGGIVGQNQVNTYIRRCYSTAAVTATNTGATGVGGIAGMNASAQADAVTGNFALNPSLSMGSGASANIHRIAGNNAGTAKLTGNYAWSGMAMTRGETPVTPTDAGANAKDGKGIPAQPLQAVYEAAGWDFSSVWEMDTWGYPKLRWQTQDTARPPLAAPVPVVAVENSNSYDKDKDDGSYKTEQGGKLTVSWTAVPGATAYDIYYAPRVTDVPEFGLATKVTVSGSDTGREITDTGIGENTMNYYVWITVTTPGGTSEASAPASTLDRFLDAWIATNGADAFLITNADVYNTALWAYLSYGEEYVGEYDTYSYIRAVVPFEGGSETVDFNGETGPAGVIVVEYDRSVDDNPMFSHATGKYFNAIYYYGLSGEGEDRTMYLGLAADLDGEYGSGDYGCETGDVAGAIAKFTFADRDKYISSAVAADYYWGTQEDLDEIIEVYSDF